MSQFAEVKIKAQPFQKEFLLSQKRFPCLKAGVGTGKTFFLLLKIYNYCQQYPNSLALIVRKEFTDLRDSTIKDFEKYFSCTINSNKEFKFQNGSVVMFRHGGELNVLKNLNLSIIGIEQAEEFENEETFHFLRDRLRRENAPYRQLCLIANANGHNWIWRLWKAEKSNDEYALWEASTFNNAENLPADFVEDLRRMEIEAPHHYRRMVLNSDDEQDVQDTLITEIMLDKLKQRVISGSVEGKRVIACDPATGGDECVIYVVENGKILHDKYLYDRDTMKIVGELMLLSAQWKTDNIAVDVIGVGKGVADRLKELKKNVIEISSAETAGDPEMFANVRAELWWKLAEKIRNVEIPYMADGELRKQLCAVKFKVVGSNGKIQLYPKDDTRKILGRSPDRADCFAYAIYAQDKVEETINLAEILAQTRRKQQQQYAHRQGGYG